MNHIIFLVVVVEDGLSIVFNFLPCSGLVPNPNIGKEDSFHTFFVVISTSIAINVTIQLNAEHIPTVLHLDLELGVEVLSMSQVAVLIEELRHRVQDRDGEQLGYVPRSIEW
jgi:hypothetical protein